LQGEILSDQNLRLRKLLKQAGLDAAARDIAEQVQSVLKEELHHRMKNMLGMVTAIVRQSMRSGTSLGDAERAISARLIAMATAHDLLLKAALSTASLTAIIQGAIQQHNTASDRIIVKGEEIEIAGSSTVPLALILNELCTNATKYGALSKDSGHVRLTWGQDKAGKRTTFRWIESGGPTVAPPSRRSFGTQLIEEALPRQLGGTGRLSFPASGVEFELVVPMKNLRSQVSA
jgi:two-component sensor histidine kinase